MRTNRTVLIFALGIVGWLVFPMLGAQQEEVRLLMSADRIYRATVPAHIAWTDTGFDVRAGQKIDFWAEGGISLQQGNPRGYCGPEGLDFSTIQQPIRDKPFGALIGKVVLLISIDIDEETGEETRNEIIEHFFIGARNSVEMPIDGNLFLGVNEQVVEDNNGEIQVEYRLRSD